MKMVRWLIKEGPYIVRAFLIIWTFYLVGTLAMVALALNYSTGRAPWHWALALVAGISFVGALFDFVLRCRGYNF